MIFLLKQNKIIQMSKKGFVKITTLTNLSAIFGTIKKCLGTQLTSNTNTPISTICYTHIYDFLHPYILFSTPISTIFYTHAYL